MRQLNMFDTADYVKLEQLDAAVDAIRQKYGIDSIKRASFIKCPFDHMEGGVSREKRTVNYSELTIQ